MDAVRTSVFIRLVLKSQVIIKPWGSSKAKIGRNAEARKCFFSIRASEAYGAAARTPLAIENPLLGAAGSGICSLRRRAGLGTARLQDQGRSASRVARTGLEMDRLGGGARSFGLL